MSALAAHGDGCVVSHSSQGGSHRLHICSILAPCALRLLPLLLLLLLLLLPAAASDLLLLPSCITAAPHACCRMSHAQPALVHAAMPAPYA
jgi:hypothetical protein